jgi:hypothetical protein
MRVQRLTRFEVPVVAFRAKPLDRPVEPLRHSSFLTLQHSVFPHSFGIQGLTAPRSLVCELPFHDARTRCADQMREEERHA